MLQLQADDKYKNLAYNLPGVIGQVKGHVTRIRTAAHIEALKGAGPHMASVSTYPPRREPLASPACCIHA